MNKGTMSMMREKMRTQMEAIKKTDDLDKREKLIQSHQSSMHEMMQDKMGNDKEKNMMMREQMMQNQTAIEKLIGLNMIIDVLTNIDD